MKVLREVEQLFAEYELRTDKGDFWVAVQHTDCDVEILRVVGDHGSALNFDAYGLGYEYDNDAIEAINDYNK